MGARVYRSPPGVGKVALRAPPAKLRCVLPAVRAVRPLDVVLARASRDFVDHVFPEAPGVRITSRRGLEGPDLAHGVAPVLEKGADGCAEG